MQIIDDPMLNSDNKSTFFGHDDLINIEAHQTELIQNPEFEKLSTLNNLLDNGN